MEYQIITRSQIAGFETFLRAEERSEGTIEKYLRDVKAFAAWLCGKGVDKAAVTEWKAALCDKGYAPVTVNSMLAAVHCFFAYAGWKECNVKYLRVQRRLFRDARQELTREEYSLLLATARKRGQDRLALLMETICATGIRVSEVKYITVEAAQRGRAEISLKGKVRTIILPAKLCRKLLKYVKQNKIAPGGIFLTRSGNGLSRRQIWTEMKRLCKYAGIGLSKVFPHNLRHLFAVSYYRACRDIARLADVLGHSSIETTRIYLITSFEEQAQQLDQLGLIS